MATMHGCSSCGEWCGEHDFLGNSIVVEVVEIAGGGMHLESLALKVTCSGCSFMMTGKCHICYGHKLQW